MTDFRYRVELHLSRPLAIDSPHWVSFDAARPDWRRYDFVDLPTAYAAMLSMIISVAGTRLADPSRRPRPTRIDWGRADHPAGGMVGGTLLRWAPS
jgi:hypothetical protein